MNSKQTISSSKKKAHIPEVSKRAVFIHPSQVLHFQSSDLNDTIKIITTIIQKEFQKVNLYFLY